MMNLTVEKYCPRCDAVLDAASINAERDIALCKSCGHLSRAADFAARTSPTATILGKTPRGCAILDRGDKIVVRASFWSITHFIWGVGFCVFWNGLISVFVAHAMSGLYLNLVGPPPDWLPTPKMNGQIMGLWTAIGLSVFLIPFVLIGVVFILVTINILFGTVRVELSNVEGLVINGFTLLNKRRTFDPQKVERVSFSELAAETSTRRRRYEILISADQEMKFGSGLTERRKDWLEAVLRTIFMKRDETTTSSPLDRARELIATTN